MIPLLLCGNWIPCHCVASFDIPVSASNPAFGVVPPALAVARDAIQRIAQALRLAQVLHGMSAFLHSLEDLLALGAPDRFLPRDEAAPHQVLQALVERLHAVLLAGLDG